MAPVLNMFTVGDILLADMVVPLSVVFGVTVAGLTISV